ncbi:Calx-beta domain-containing protein, partial [Alphaproteobacteria bacterium]|nr:Calx-beta domain-containing protein [Alphaproteobacteria bacterium]
EGAGTHSFTVSLSSVAASSLSVDYTTSNGTALAGSDYTGMSSTLNFATGEQTKTVSVTIIDDSDTEASESFSLTLSNPVNVTLGTSSASVSITDNDISIEQSLIDEAETYVRGVSDQLAQEKGHDLIEASHRLIRASLDSVMIQSSVLASKAEPNTPEPRTGFADSTSSQTSRQAFFSQPDTPILDAQTTFKQNLVGAVKSLDVAADDGSHHAHFNYDLYTPLIRSNDRLITKIAAQTSKQKNGPEARRLIASFALEKKASDEQSAIGRFVHLTHENADFNTEYKGDKNTSGVNIGIYKVYTADVDVLNSAYFSAGISNTDLSLTKSGMLLDSTYLSYQFQTGFSVGRVYKAKRFAGILEFSIDALYDYQNGHDLNITYGISKFNRLMSGKGHHEIIARLEPKANFELGKIKNGKARILQVTPLLKCGTGSMSADCGGGLSAKVSSPFEGDKGHLSFGIRYEHYRDTDFMEYLMNINQNLFNSDQIKLNTELKVDTNDVLPSSSAGQYKVGSSLNVTF